MFAYTDMSMWHTQHLALKKRKSFNQC